MADLQSIVFGAIEHAREALAAADWPVHEGTQLAPTVTYGDQWEESDPMELIGVRHRVEDDALIARTGSPNVRREIFAMDIVIRTEVPGVTREVAWHRLCDLSAVVQGIFSDPREAPWKDEPWAVALGGVTRVAPRLTLHSEGGHSGECIVTVAVHGNI
jgi:hypothetical protein